MRWRKHARAATEQAMREATGQGGLDSEDAIRLRELERTAAVNKSLFDDFLQKAKVTDEQSTFRARDVRVIMPAQAGWQSFPNTRRILMMALFRWTCAWHWRRAGNGDAECRFYQRAADRTGIGNSRACVRRQDG